MRWVASAYALTFAGFLLLGGRLADVVGRRLVFVAGHAAIHYVSAILGHAVLISLGGGLLNTPLAAVVTFDVDGRNAGSASGLMNTTK